MTATSAATVEATSPPDLSQEPPPGRYTLHVGDDEPGKRLDVLLCAKLPGLSRSRAAWHIQEGHVAIVEPARLQAIRLKSGLQLPRRTVIAIELQPRTELSAEPEAIPLRIVHEDDDVLVIDKPAGLVAHPALGHESGTLVNALLHHLPAVKDVGDKYRPGLVHRLDKDTSGLLLVAKTERALRVLGKAFMRHDIERRYAAIALGTFPEDRFTIQTLHGRAAGDRKKFSGKVPEGKEAITHVTVLARAQLCCLVVCELETGRTHQIRVHLSERGHPVAGDALYGGVRQFQRTGRTAHEAKLLESLPRHALHAYALGFAHPVTGQRLRFHAEWPADLAAVVGGVFGEVELPRLASARG
jgi:23S rRNA pseudouridine1911/1915/1917 synthase